MHCHQELNDIIAYPSPRGNITSREEITPRNSAKSPSPNLLSSNSNSNPSFEDLDSFFETKRPSTPTPIIILFGRTGVGKSSYQSTIAERFTIDFTDLPSGKASVEQLLDGPEILQNIKHLGFVIRNQTEETASVIKDQFSKIFNEKLSSLQSLELDFFRSQIAIACVDYLNKEGLLNFRSLKRFKINLWGSDISNLSIQRLGWNLKHMFGELEEFYCNLGETQVTEKALIQFFHEMPKMKHFEMSVGNCTFSDYGLKIFIRNSLSSMKSLESLSLQLEGTKISSSQIRDLLKHLPESLKKLRLDLRWTKTCEDAFEDFFKEKLRILKNLIEIELKVDCTLISEKIIKKIEEVNKRFARKIDSEACSKYLKTLRFKEN